MANNGWPNGDASLSDHEDAPRDIPFTPSNLVKIIAALPLTSSQLDMLAAEVPGEVFAPTPAHGSVAHAFVFLNVCPHQHIGRVHLVRLLDGISPNDIALQLRANEHGRIAHGPLMFGSNLVHGYWSLADEGCGFHWWVEATTPQDNEHTMLHPLILAEPFQVYGTWPLLRRPGDTVTQVRASYAVRVSASLAPFGLTPRPNGVHHEG